MALVSGKRFFTWHRASIALRRVGLPLCAVYLGVALIATAREASVMNDEYAAVLLSDYAVSQYDYWASPAAFLGAYIPWTNYFANRNLKVRWFLRARSTDLEKVIRDGKCQSIVLVGHGSRNCWQATDTEVSNHEVRQMMQGFPRKRGEWLQLTCGVDDIYPERLGELVMEKERVYSYGKAVSTYVFVTDALFGFRYLKHVSR